ncbi:MAG: glutathione S-transferase [Pseudomonadota bacterium]
MTYDLYLGDYTYSSWSLRAYLLFDRFSIPVSTHMIWFGEDRSVGEGLAAFGVDARTVPTVVIDKTTTIGDSLAIAEELASRHPDAGYWPDDAAARARARWLAAEMHSGFAPLRSACPMDLRRAYRGFEPDAAVLENLAGIEQIWTFARAEGGSDTPWLCGRYSIADAFFAPVAARIATFDLPVGDVAQAYVAAHLADPSFRRWRSMALAEGNDLSWYAQDLPERPWPGPAVQRAEVVESGPAINYQCPYSGGPVTHFLELDGAVWGFCNAFCRDKTAFDPDAWDAFVALRGG